MRGCVHVNAVSRLHAEISRDLIGELYPRWPHAEIPVRAITNGVHVPTWASQRAAKLWGEEDGSSPMVGRTSSRVRSNTRKRPPLICGHFVRHKGRHCWSTFTPDKVNNPITQGTPRTEPQEMAVKSDPPLDDMLDPNVLTIGFARRFATYKRATLLLSDPDRLRRLLLDEQRPIQLLIAGKAHPNDRFGKTLVQQMTQFLRRKRVSQSCGLFGGL